jgi:hypothetical protein
MYRNLSVTVIHRLWNLIAEELHWRWSSIEYRKKNQRWGSQKKASLKLELGWCTSDSRFHNRTVPSSPAEERIEPVQFHETRQADGEWQLLSKPILTSNFDDGVMPLALPTPPPPFDWLVFEEQEPLSLCAKTKAIVNERLTSSQVSAWQNTWVFVEQ